MFNAPANMLLKDDAERAVKTGQWMGTSSVALWRGVRPETGRLWVQIHGRVMQKTKNGTQCLILDTNL